MGSGRSLGSQNCLILSRNDSYGAQTHLLSKQTKAAGNSNSSRKVLSSINLYSCANNDPDNYSYE